MVIDEDPALEVAERAATGDQLRFRFRWRKLWKYTGPGWLSELPGISLHAPQFMPSAPLLVGPCL